MPLPSKVTFTPFVDIYGMLSLKQLVVDDWGEGSGEASLTNMPVVPLRTPMFQSRMPLADRGAMNLSRPAEQPQGRQDAPVERGSDLTRTWVLFFERILALLRRTAGASSRLRKLHAILCYVDETETKDIWAVIGAVDAATDPITVLPFTQTPRSTIPPFAEPWSVGDYVVWNDPLQSAADDTRRRYECAKITAIDEDTGEWTIHRHWPGTPAGQAAFETHIEAHAEVRLYRVTTSLFTLEIKQNEFVVDSNGETSGVPRRWDITLPHSAVVAVYMAAENESGIGPWTGVNTSYPFTNEVTQLQPAPGLRTHVGAAYWFEEPGDIVARDRPDGSGGTISTLNFYPTLPIRIQDWTSIRTNYGFVGTPTVDAAADEPLSLKLKILLAADRVDNLELYDPAQPWQDLETLLWQKHSTGICDTCSADQGTIGGISWVASQDNPPAERRMPYCEGDVVHWDPEISGKAWPTAVIEADAWLTFDVLVASLGADSSPPVDLMVAVQT